MYLIPVVELRKRCAKLWCSQNSNTYKVFNVVPKNEWPTPKPHIRVINKLPQQPTMPMFFSMGGGEDE